ncbi:MAG: molecular chaperone HtpG [Simkania negevensis]|nr:molecular chaperone HtpG [Simkania negevensis]
MSKGTLKIHSQNILPIIKKWLYTDKEIFLRELVSNACDALSKIKLLKDQEKISLKEEELKIDIEIDKKNKTIKVIDSGIGMTGEEVKKYIAQLAFSGAEEFVEKYQTKKEEIIGHFGLGFYSAFMVSEQVDIETRSFDTTQQPAFWSCDGSSDYTLSKGSREKRGTEIILHLTKEEEEFLEEGRLRTILNKHCRFLPYPIFLNGTQTNDKEPLWMKPPAECTEKDYLEFYHILYPFDPDPIFWIHLNVDYPFHLKGILYFPKITKRFDFSEPSVHLYCNRVFVSENCKDLIPDYLTALRGIIDSPDIPLNVSRSSLQMDRTVRQLGSHISKKVADRLLSFYQSDRATYIEKWPDVEMIVKFGILQDDKFYEKMKPALIWKTEGNLWTTTEEYLERNKEKNKDIIYYLSDEKHSSHLLDLYKNKGIEILYATSQLDLHLINFLESKLQGTKFRRLDGALGDLLLNPEKEKSLLDAEGRSESSKIATFFRSQLEEVEVEAKSLESESLPSFILINEESRRLKESFYLSGKELPPSFEKKHTFVVNTNSPLILSLFKLGEKDPQLAKSMAHHLYEVSLLSQKELHPSALSHFVKRSSELLETLAKKASSP